MLAPYFAMVGGIRKHLVVLDPSRVRRLVEIVQNDVLDVDIDIGQGRIGAEFRDGLIFLLALDDGVLDIAVEEVERGGLIAFDGVPIALEVERGPPCQVILVLRLLRLVLIVSVVDSLGAPGVRKRTMNGFIFTKARSLLYVNVPSMKQIAASTRTVILR